MSIYSKMTAIADKIRAIRGITGTMGLDSMANNLGTIQTDVIDAFTAIGNKGGTVPSSKVSGDIVAAIQSIPEGVTVQRANGTVTIGNDGAFYADCGFLPDLITIALHFGEEGEMTLVFTPTEIEIALGASECRASSIHPSGFVQGVCRQSDEYGFTGLAGYIWCYNWDWSAGTFIYNTEHPYIAVKYT